MAPKTVTVRALCLLALALLTPSAVRAQAPSGQAPSGQAGVTEHDAVIRNVTFASGEKLDEVRLHYRTLGTLQKDAQGRPTNAVLILHGTGGSGAQFLSPQFAKELFGAGQLLDAAKYFLILPDNIGHGKSSKPSDGLRMRFPKYGYQDMVKLQYQLITEHLKIDHLRLVMGTSMGGMHTWVWATRYPQMADGWMPLASVPTAIVGRNRMWRTALADTIKDDPEWQDGNYQTQPLRGIRAALRLQSIMSSVPLQWHTDLGPTREKADEFIRNFVTQRAGNLDANDMLYQFDSSRDYDPSTHLEQISAPVLAINSADDQINPPELGLMEKLMPRVEGGKYVLIPISPASRGHSSHTWAVLWMDAFREFLSNLPAKSCSC
jgi:homoserine O-acetyltransferase